MLDFFAKRPLLLLLFMVAIVIVAAFVFWKYMDASGRLAVERTSYAMACCFVIHHHVKKHLHRREHLKHRIAR